MGTPVVAALGINAGTSSADALAEPRVTRTTDHLYENVLILRCQGGDEAAFEELVVRYAPRLRYYLRKMLTEAGGPEDALQDVWVEVLRGLPRLASPGAFATWLYRIARDRAYRQLRRRWLRHESLHETEVPDAGTVEEEVLAADEAQQIHHALDGLAPEHREVLVLRFLEDMPYDEIAQVTGCPLGTVRSRLYYAKRSVRLALERMRSHGG